MNLSFLLLTQNEREDITLFLLSLGVVLTVHFPFLSDGNNKIKIGNKIIFPS